MLGLRDLSHFLEYSSAFTVNDMPYKEKPVAIGLRISDDCIGLFEDHNACRVDYQVDTKN